MSKYQIIYTSCKRGIAGNSEGLQVYSHSPKIPGKPNDYVKGLLSYQPPTNVPKKPIAFVYRRISNKTFGLALKTHLSRDHTGKMVSNYLSHGVVVEEKELKFYPAEAYGSGMWNSCMDEADVSSPEIPPLLPEPNIIKGQRVSIESVMDFLTDNRIVIYKKMLASMFLSKTAKKKVIICDDSDNIIMWIAALHYALPLEIAMDVGFATYDHDPVRSHYQICGAVPEGTAYNPKSAHFIFDFTRGIFPNIETRDVFFRVLDEGLASSNIQRFHRFIIEKLTYRSADENYYKAYALFRLLNEERPLSLNSFKNAMLMANSHAYKDVLTETFGVILSRRDFILSVDDEYALEIFTALLSKSPMLEGVGELIAERVITDFASKEANRDSFLGFYRALGNICEARKVSISAELIKDANIKTIAAHLADHQWRWDFFVEIYCDYVVSHKIPVENLSLDHKLGRLIGDIVATRLAADPNLGLVLITRIIVRLSHDWSYLANMALNLEGVILDAPDSEMLCEKHWAYFYDMFVLRQSQNRQHVYDMFLSLDRADQVFDLYAVLMSRAANVKAARELFLKAIEIKDKLFLQEYRIRIYERYYSFPATQRDSAARRELIRLIARDNITADFVPDLIDVVLDEIPIGSLSKDNEKMVNTLLDYCRESLPNRLILLASGMLIGKVSSAYELENTMKTIRHIAKAETISGADSKYINWVAPTMFGCAKTPEELSTCYNLYEHTSETTVGFVEAWARESMRVKELGGMMMFIGFLFIVGDAGNRQEAGIILGKLSKPRLEALNEAVSQKYHGDVKHLFYWSEVYEAATSSSSLLAGIGNLFRRK